MSGRFKSGVLSALIVLTGMAGLVAFVAAPPAAYAILWLASEIRALRHRPKRDFLQFELDPFDAARLDAARDAAADIIQHLADLDAGRIHNDDPDVADRLIERYRVLRMRMAGLRAIPIRQLRQWSSARAMVSAARIGLIGIPLLAAAYAGLMIMIGSPSQHPPYRILAAACALWMPCVFPILFWLRRRRLEHGLGDRAMFYERWRPDDDFLDFYLARTEPPMEQGREDAEHRAGPRPEPEPQASGNDRPKRPWHVVLEVPADAGAAEIKRAYHARMKEYHPDRTAGLGIELRSLAETISREITSAYEEAGRSQS